MADQIPGDEAHAGIGFVIDAGSRLPVRVRAGWVTDDEIDELVMRCTPTCRIGYVVDINSHPDAGSSDEQGGAA
jgi:S-DNA-T family DNA segregation ATPase FtsK/SpoIIIE